MVNVKNIGEGTLSFKDDTGKVITLDAGESVECKYERSMDDRLIIEKKSKKKKGEDE